MSALLEDTQRDHTRVKELEKSTKKTLDAANKEVQKAEKAAKSAKSKGGHKYDAALDVLESVSATSVAFSA